MIVCRNTSSARRKWRWLPENEKGMHCPSNDRTAIVGKVRIGCSRCVSSAGRLLRTTVCKKEMGTAMQRSSSRRDCYIAHCRYQHHYKQQWAYKWEDSLLHKKNSFFFKKNIYI